MTNPYLKVGRLSEVIAAITALGTYKFYKLDAGGWAKRISGGGKTADYWTEVFDEHPEFFRRASENEKFSLVWRRQFPRSYLVGEVKEFSPDDAFDGNAASRVSRRPLEPGEITSLISIAVSLHQAALEMEKSGRWWIQLVPAVLGFLGAIIAVLLGKFIV